MIEQKKTRKPSKTFLVFLHAIRLVSLLCNKLTTALAVP